MAKKTPVEQFRASIGKALQEYADSVTDDVKALSRTFAQKGAQAVKNASASTFGGTGKYARGWSYQMEETRLSAQGVIYNKDAPGLPHLLEHGHANRGGGRTPGRAHIAPVEAEIIDQFERAVKGSI